MSAHLLKGTPADTRSRLRSLYQRLDHDYHMRAAWPYMRSIRIGVNTRHSCTHESKRSPRHQRSKVRLELYLANVHSASENTPGLVHMRSTRELCTQVWSLSLRQPYNISIWNQAYRTTQTRASARIPTVNPIQALLDRSLMNFVETLHTSLIMKYSMTVRHPPPAYRFIMKAPGK